MSDEKRKVGFLSYAHEDRSYADRLYADLSDRDIRIWYDVQDFDQTQDVDAQILNAIQETNFVLVLLSPTSVTKDGYVRKEIRHAIEVMKRLRPKNEFLIPIRVVDCTPLEKELQGLDIFIDLFRDWEKGIEEIDKLIPYENDPLDFSEMSPHQIQANLASLDYLKRAVTHYDSRFPLGVFLRNCLSALRRHDDSILSRKHRNIDTQLNDFCACMELHFVHDCGKIDEATTCHQCNASSRILHGTEEVGGRSQSDYNDNYIVLCTACFWCYYDFEVDYLGTGPLRFDYSKNIYV